MDGTVTSLYIYNTRRTTDIWDQKKRNHSLVGGGDSLCFAICEMIQQCSKNIGRS